MNDTDKQSIIVSVDKDQKRLLRHVYFFLQNGGVFLPTTRPYCLAE